MLRIVKRLMLGLLSAYNGEVPLETITMLGKFKLGM